ncbi:MAG: isoprenylcysteine carboxylmethyltransferase family protein [Candidatus Hydrogenedentes bacterium]|nr:isoprenylcysteine carboxylmethyltransferase family protein [Candidatus Hydrogenedentota bacterium]
MDVGYRIALAIVAVAHGVFSRRYVRGARAGATLFKERAEGRGLAAATGAAYAAYCFTVLAFMINPAWMGWSALPIPPWLRWVGAPVMAAGAALHIWGMHHLGKNLTISISTRAGHALVTSGPFRWIRHPLYSGGMLESVGVCLLLANGAVSACALAFWLLIAWRTPLEEAILEDAFGERYRQYRGYTGRFLPRVTRG